MTHRLLFHLSLLYNIKVSIYLVQTLLFMSYMTGFHNNISEIHKNEQLVSIQLHLILFFAQYSDFVSLTD